MARTADSRPEPGPTTRTSTSFIPSAMAFLAAWSADTCAAKGVDLRDPLKPDSPPQPHATTLPSLSVIVTIVLLKEDLTNAIPEDTVRFTFFLTFFFTLANPASSLPSAGYFLAFFFRPTVLRGPFRVRALVRVRWP